MGLRLWGMALEPFWPAREGSSASPTSVRCQWRTLVASRSMPAAARASAREQLGVPVARRRSGVATSRARGRGARGPAPRSRGRWRRRSRPRPRSRRRRSRAKARSQARGCGRPQGEARELDAEGGRLGVDAVGAAHGERAPCSRARAASAADELAAPARIGSPAARSCSARAVSSTSEEVRPKWIQRPASPGGGASTSTKAATSCSVTTLALVDGLDGESRPADRLELAARSARLRRAGRAAPRRPRPRRGASPPCAPRRSTGGRARAGCSGRRSRQARGSAPRARPRCGRCRGPTQATGTPGGICTIERIASSPPAAVRRLDRGTPITGRSV